MALDVDVFVEAAFVALQAAGFFPPERASQPMYPNGGGPFPPTVTVEAGQRLYLKTIFGVLIKHIQTFGEVVAEVSTTVNAIDTSTSAIVTGTGAGSVVPKTGKVL